MDGRSSASQAEADDAPATSLEFSFTRAQRLGQSHHLDNDPARVLDTDTPLVPVTPPAESSIVNYRPEQSLNSRREIGPAKESDVATTRRELLSQQCKRCTTIDTSINSGVFVPRPTTSDTVSKARPVASRMPGIVKAAQKLAGPIPRRIVVLMVLNVVVTTLVVGLNVYQRSRVHDLYSKANSVRGAAADATVGLAEFARNIDISLKSTRENVASQFSAQNATCAAKLTEIIAACTEIKAWAATVKATTAKIYSKLLDHDKVVAAVNGNSDEVLEKIAALKTSIDDRFPAAAVTDAIVKSTNTMLGQTETKVSANINSDLSAMNAAMRTSAENTIDNANYVGDYLISGAFISSPASVACATRRKSILVVSLPGYVYMPSIINPSTITARVDQVFCGSDWIYCLISRTGTARTAALRPSCRPRWSPSSSVGEA